MQGHTDSIWSVAFSPDGQTIASSGGDSTDKLWSVSTGQCRQTFQTSIPMVRSIAFSPVSVVSSQILATIGQDHAVNLWDINTACCLKTLPRHHVHTLAVTFSPQGNILACSSRADSVISLWDWSNGECLHLQEHTGKVFSVAFHPDGDLIASGHDCYVKLWNVNGQCLKELQGHTARISSQSQLWDSNLPVPPLQ